MNCSVASVLTLIRHPRHRDEQWVIDEATIIAQLNAKGARFFTWVPELPVPAAKRLMESHLPKLLRSQRTGGTWKIKDAQRLSYETLCALKHSGLLDHLIADNQFRHDPFQAFSHENDYLSLVTRKHIMEQPAEGDEQYCRDLIRKKFAKQQKDGSWYHSVMSTAKEVEQILALGLSPRDERLRKAAEWVFSMCHEELERESSRFGGKRVGHHMFTNPDRHLEFERALEDRPEWDPKNSCYRHLALVQNGVAIRMLISLGYAEDDRVVAACENLVEINKTYKGFCDTQIRKGFEAEKRAKKASKNDILDPETNTIKNGLRYDPFKWINQSRTVEGALARRIMDIAPHTRDQKIINNEIDRLISEQLDRGRTDGGDLFKLAELGITSGNKALKDIIKKSTKAISPTEEGWSCLDWASLYYMSDRSNSKLSSHLTNYGTKEKPWDNAYRGCPWWLELHWYSLWHCRDIPGMEEAISQSIASTIPDMDEHGHSYCTPWGFLQAAGYINTPEAREMVLKMLPWIVRTQKSNGGWETPEGTHGSSFGTTIDVLRALKTHGLLESIG